MELSGISLAHKVLSEIRRSGKRAVLAVVLVGEDAASLSYIKSKERVAEELGFGFKLFELPSFAGQKDVEKLIGELNESQTIDGIVVQLPLPSGFQTEEVLKKISPSKDIDGFSGDYPAPTARAIVELLKYYNIDLKNKKVVIVGYGRLVGQPLKKILKSQGIESLICDSHTENLEKETLNADVLISATGVPSLIKKDMVKNGAVVVDAGTSEAHGKVVGDVDEGVFTIAGFYTPKKGGVGPLTVAYLMENLLKAIENSKFKNQSAK